MIMKYWFYIEFFGLGLFQVYSSAQVYIMYYEEEMLVINLSSIGVNCKRVFKVLNVEKGN